MPLDEDDEHARYDPGQVDAYFAAATRAALVLAEFRAPYRGRSTPVNAWWGSFDLAVSLFSGLPADPPSDDFIMRNSMDAQEVAVGWWPGDARYGKAAFYAYAHPAPDGFADATLHPPPRAGTPSSACTCSTGTTPAPRRTRTRPRSPSCARPSACVHRVRMGPRAGRQRGGQAATHPLTRTGRGQPAIASSARFAISFGGTSSTWVATDHWCPNGSSKRPERSP